MGCGSRNEKDFNCLISNQKVLEQLAVLGLLEQEFSRNLGPPYLQPQLYLVFIARAERDFI